MSETAKQMMNENDRFTYTVDEVHELFHRALADEAVAASRRAQRIELRPPHIRPWGIAAGAQPYRRSTFSAIGWWAIVATVAVCAIAIMVAI